MIGTSVRAERTVGIGRGAMGARIAWPATLAAKRGAALDATHLRYRRESAAPGALHCFVLDCSGSMLEARRLARAKGLVLALLERAARERAQAALVCFGGGRAELRFGPAVPRWWNERWLDAVGAGGGTSLAAGIDAARGILARDARRAPQRPRWLWLLSDGRTNERPAKPDAADRIVVVDLDDSIVRARRCERLAEAWGAVWLPPHALIRA